MVKRNGETIAISGEEFEQALEQLRITFQNKTILWNGENKLVTTVLQEIFEMANGKVQLVIANTLPETTVANTQYWVKTYNEQTLETGRYIIVTDSLNAPTYIGTTETDLSEYLKKTDNPNKLYGTDGDGEQQEYNIIDSLATDYYYKWNKDSTNKFTKQITDGINIDVYDIVFENGKVKTVTKSATDGTIANGVLTLNAVEYSHDATGDGIYLVNSDIKIINASALNDLLNVALNNVNKQSYRTVSTKLSLGGTEESSANVNWTCYKYPLGDGKFKYEWVGIYSQNKNVEVTTAYGSGFMSKKFAITLPDSNMAGKCIVYAGQSGSTCWVSPSMGGTSLDFYILRFTSTTVNNTLEINISCSYVANS